MFALPAETAVTSPVFDTVAIPTAFEAQLDAVGDPVNWLVVPIHKEVFPVTVGSALTVTVEVTQQLLMLV